MTYCLFIGGLRDGEWHDVPNDRDYYDLPQPVGPPTPLSAVAVNAPTAFVAQRYVR